jgi:serine/threonine protein kinase
MTIPKSVRVGSKIRNEITREQFRLVGRLGQGGYGTTFEAVRMGDPDAGPTCLKLTTDAEQWHAESYFGRFLQGSPRAVQLIDSFPVVWTTGQQRIHRRVLFAIQTELITTGTVRDACRAGPSPWPDERVIRQIGLLLRMLDHLHLNGVSHCDITPPNVFVTRTGGLKLGDFGITKMQRGLRKLRIDAASWPYAPPGIQTFWDARDDIYQVGLLTLSLLTGTDVTNDATRRFVNTATADPELREVVKKAISRSRTERYAGAGEMADALAALRPATSRRR